MVKHPITSSFSNWLRRWRAADDRIILRDRLDNGWKPCLACQCLPYYWSGVFDMAIDGVRHIKWISSYVIRNIGKLQELRLWLDQKILRLIKGSRLTKSKKNWSSLVILVFDDVRCPFYPSVIAWEGRRSGGLFSLDDDSVGSNGLFRHMTLVLPCITTVLTPYRVIIEHSQSSIND